MLRFLVSFLVIIAIVCSSLAQCENGRYRNFVFTNFDLTSDVLYGNNLDHNEVSTDLYLDVYQPSGDTEINRPLVIVAHGGSFVGGSKDGTDVVPICQDLAKMGYVVASIQYRLGIALDLAALTQNAKAAVIRGAQDSKAAVRYFRQDVELSENSYSIDPDKIYMLGVSAGGFNALNVAYLTTDEEIPSDIDLSDPGLGGGAEGLSGNPGYSSSIAGVVNIAGAIAGLDLIQANDAPIVSFHGTNDGTVPYGSDILYLLQTFPIDSVHGSESIHARADELGIENCFEIQENQGHVPHVSNTLYYDTIISISSNFLSHLVCPEVALDCDYRELEIISSLEEQGTLDIAIWPIPVQEQLEIRGLTMNSHYRLLDGYGRMVDEGDLHLSAPIIDTRALSTGVYMVILENEDGHAVRKIVK